MSRRVAAVRGSHHHLAWEDQPLVRSTARRGTLTGGTAGRLILLAFVAGLVVGLLI